MVKTSLSRTSTFTPRRGSLRRTILSAKPNDLVENRIVREESRVRDVPAAKWTGFNAPVRIFNCFLDRK
jgi:hypothetical protein